VHPVIEEDIVADFRAKPDWSDEAFDTSAWIEGKVSRAAAQADRISESGGSSGVANAEVFETHLTGHEDTERAGCLKFRTEKSVQYSQSALNGGRGYTIAEGAGEIAREVVAHLRFDLNVGMNVKGTASTESDHVTRGWPGITEAEIFGEDTNFSVIFRRTLSNHRRCDE